MCKSSLRSVSNWKYFIFDIETRGILLVTSNMQTAVLVAQGLLNSHLFSWYFDKRIHSYYSHFNLDKDLLLLTKDFKIIPADGVAFTENFLSKKALAQKRAHSIEQVLLACMRLWHRSASGYSNEIYSEIQFELQDCRPLDGYFTSSIHDYADILMITPEEAFTDLKIAVESSRANKIRNFAIFSKYVKAINSSSLQELEAFSSQIMAEVTANSQV